MAKLCLNCGRANRDRATTCKKCNTSLGHALHLDAQTPSWHPFMVLGAVGILILVVVVLNPFGFIPF